MAVITESEALVVLPLAHMKDELRIPDGEKDHDDLLRSQIVAAVSYAVMVLGAEDDDLLPLRAAAVSLVRSQYNGGLEVKETAAFHAWLAPVRSYKTE